MEINRRQFLIKTSSSIAAGLALYKGLRPSSAAAEEVNSIPWVTPAFLMTYPVAASDYRPVVNSTATGLIFERTIKGLRQLYSLDLTTPSAVPSLMIKGWNEESARPDWSWQTGELVYMNNNGIYLFNNPTTVLPNTKKMSYPTWYPDGTTLAVYNNRVHSPALPIPRTSTIDLTGKCARPIW
jgi:hypothetical protein